MHAWYTDLFIKDANTYYQAIKEDLGKTKEIDFHLDSVSNRMGNAAYPITHVPDDIVKNVTNRKINGFDSIYRMKEYFDQMNIDEISGTSLNDIINIAKEVIRTDNDNILYGVLVGKVGDSNYGKFNILHPVNAYRLIQMTEEEREEEKYIAHFYSYDKKSHAYARLMKSNTAIKYSDVENEITDILGFVYRDASSFVQGYSNIHLEYSPSNKLVVSYDVVTMDQDGNTVEVSGDSKKSFFVPVQIANMGGIMYPLYGGVMTYGSAGINVMGHLSCNLSSSRSMNSICTGDVARATLDGARTLNHSNHGSPYNSTSFDRTTFFQYAKYYAEISLSILDDESSVDAGEVVEHVLTREEYSEKYKDATLSDYLDYIKDGFLSKVATKEEPTNGKTKKKKE